MRGIYRRSFWRRFLQPVGTLLLVWLAADVLLAMMTDPQFTPSNPGFYKILSNFLAGIRFGLILLGALFLYPTIYFRGASPSERVLGAYVIVFAYMITAMFRSTAYFSVGQAIYYGFNQLALASFFFQFSLVSLCEVGCRWWYRRRYRDPIWIVRWPYVAGIFAGFAALYVALFWEGGVHWFYVYQEGYKLLFP